MSKHQNKERAGIYREQPAGYKAFIPNPLPPKPPINKDEDMLSLLSKADRALGRLDGVTEILPNADLFVIMYIKKEAVLSSQIEGTQASLQDVLEYEASALEHDRPQDAPEVINYVNAMKYGLKRLDDLPVSLRLIKEIHKEMLTGVRGSKLNPGEFRQSQNWIGAIVTGMTEFIFGSGAGKAEIEKQTPIGRVGMPEDIAKVVLFLSSDDADFITGQAIVADGGLTVGIAGMG